MKTILDSLANNSEDTFCLFIKTKNTETISRRQLREHATRYASYFQSQGIQSGELVLIFLPHSVELFYSFLGAMLLGAVPAFMPTCTSKQDPASYWHAHAALFARIATGTIITTQENLGNIKQNIQSLSLRLLPLPDSLPNCTEFTPVHTSAADIAFLQHSSGTTGLKKGVMLSHETVLRQVENYAQTLNLTHKDKIVSWLPLYHDMGLIACFILPLVKNITVVMLNPFEWVMQPKLLFDAITHFKCTLCWMPNFAFMHIWRCVSASTTVDLSSMRAWFNCSERCHTESFNLFIKKFEVLGVKPTQLQVTYGLAENVFATTQTRLDEEPMTLGVDRELLQLGKVQCTNENPQYILSTGYPLPNQIVQIINDEIQQGEDLVGEVCLSEGCLFSGYYKQLDETQKKLRNGRYYTGDIGFLHADQLFILGRKDDLIIVHGRNYYAHEIEHIVNQVPTVHAGRCVALGVTRPQVGSEEVIVILEHTNNSIIPDIKSALVNQANLTVYDVVLVPTGWLIKTTSGKISRSENIKKYLTSINFTV